MKKLILPFLLLAMLGLLAACSSDQTVDKLNGNWTVDIAASLEQSGEEWPAETRALMESMLAGLGYGFDTAAKQITVFGMGDGANQTYSYTVDSQDDTHVTLVFQDTSITFELIDEQTIQTVDEQGGVTIFKKG